MHRLDATEFDNLHLIGVKNQEVLRLLFENDYLGGVEVEKVKSLEE